MSELKKIYSKAILIICTLAVCYSHSKETIFARILGGRDSIPGKFPFRVSIQSSIPPFTTSEHFCAGSILNDLWILTASQCVEYIRQYDTLRNIVIKAGKYDLGKIEDFEQTLSVNLTYIPEYFDSLKILRQSIGLIKLSSPLRFNERVKAMSIGYEFNENVTISGWGPITNKQLFPDYPTILQEVTVPVTDLIECRETINEFAEQQGKVFGDFIYDGSFCTESFGRYAEPCGGDFGGPITTEEYEGTKVVGIVSWGDLPCTDKNLPSVFTKLSYFVPLINKTIL